MNPLSGPTKTSIETTQPTSKFSRALTNLQAKTDQVGAHAISFLKTSFERLERDVNLGFTKIKGKLENSSTFTKATTLLKQATHNVGSKDVPLTQSSDVRSLKINEEMKKLENHKALSKLSTDVNKEIALIESKSFKDEDDKEKLERLKLMQGKLNADPDFFLKKMAQYGHGKSALYSHLQPTEFLSILVKSNQNMGILENIRPGSGNPSGLSEEERVALHHYTTKGYVAINQAGRNAKLNGTPIEDAGMRACFDLTVSALKKLPNAPAVNKDGSQVSLKRSYFPPFPNADPVKNQEAQNNFKAFVEKNFVEGHIFNDGSFLSTTLKGGTPGAYNVTFEIPEGAKTIPNGKQIGFPYSAFSGVDKPDEGEVLFSPDVEFKVSKVDGSKITFQFI